MTTNTISNDTQNVDTMGLVELHHAAVDRWNAEPELASYVLDPKSPLYWDDGVPYLGSTFLQWALTAPAAEIVAHYAPGGDWTLA